MYELKLEAELSKRNDEEQKEYLKAEGYEQTVEEVWEYLEEFWNRMKKDQMKQFK